MFKRTDLREFDQLRPIKITKNYTKYAEGSVLIEFGNTKVICNATIDETLPQHVRNGGWITAEYSMLPRATHNRTKRDGVVGKVNSRAQEISRLIGRSLRNCVDLKHLGRHQILIDCDVIQADGGTRVASITGSFIALYAAISKLIESGKIKKNPIKYFIAAVSVGIVQNNLLLDLDYSEDSSCDTDMNLVMNEKLEIIEIQGCAEGEPFSYQELDGLNKLAQSGIKQLIQLQKESLI